MRKVRDFKVNEDDLKSLKTALAEELKCVVNTLAIAAFDLDAALPDIDRISEDLLAAKTILVKQIKELEK